MAKINWDAFDLQLILNKKSIDLKKKYQEEIRFSKETIHDDLMQQASKYAFYAIMAELAEEAYDDAKLELELLEATLDEHYRNKFLQSGDKITEKKLEKVVALNKARIESVKDKIMAKKNWGILKALTKAFEQRKEGVIALASIYRQEHDVDIFIKKEELRKKFEKK